MSILTIKDLSLRFGSNEAVKNVSLEVQKGEMLALVGESGSGKSLTALSCLGLQPASAQLSGSITLDGQPIIGTNENKLRTLRGKTASMIFQEPMTALNPLHPISRQIGEMMGHRAHKPRIIELLEQVGLGHFKDRLDAYPHQLSGGERQRVMIAMAIANNPALLIADEPTTAVDVTIQAKILKLIKELQMNMRMSVLFITHDLTIVRKMADRVAVMKAGEIVEIGKVSDVFAAPKHEYTKLLLSSEPKGSPAPAPSGTKDLLKSEHLKVHFPIKTGLFRKITGYIKAVDDISITIPESSTLGIVGESGSGKSTLGFALLRLVKSIGTIVYLGNRIDQLSASAMRPLRKEMQFVFQDPYSSLNPRMTIGQIIEEGLRLHFPSKAIAEREADIDAILQEVGLTPAMKDRYPHEFSGGQRQRISIARAMVLNPKLVILDEPTSALDLSVQAQIIELLKKLQQKYGLSYIFISHDLRVIRAISHQIAVMRHGKIVEYGPTGELLAHPKEQYTKELIAAAMLA